MDMIVARKPRNIRIAQGLVVVQAVLTLLAVPLHVIGILWNGFFHDLGVIPGGLLEELGAGLLLPLVMISLAAFLQARFTLSRLALIVIEAVLLFGAVTALLTLHPVHALVIGIFPALVLYNLTRPADRALGYIR